MAAKPHRNVGMRLVNFVSVILLLVIAVVPSTTDAQRSEVRGRITTGPTVSLITAAIDPFILDNNLNTARDTLLADSLRKILKDDLVFSLYFNIVEPDSTFLADIAGSRMTLDDWIYVGAQMLIKGRLTKSEGIYTLSIEVVDAMRNKLLYSHDFLGEISEYRYLAHRVADDLVRQLTGENSVFFSKIVYCVRYERGSDIYVCDFDGYNPVRITTDGQMNSVLNVLPAWSAKGDGIYFTSYRRGNPDLYWYDFGKGETVLISSREGLNYAVAPSPDDNYLAVVLTFGSNSEIYLLDKKGRIVRQVSYSWSIDTSPTWSPNSRQLAFVSDRTGSPQIYVTDIDGTNTRRLTYVGDYNTDPAWSPRGDRIAYTARENGLFQIYAVDITGQKTYKLTDWGSNEAPSWSPDGLHIVYSSDVDGTPSLWVMNFDGSGKKKLPVGGICKQPDWSVNLR